MKYIYGYIQVPALSGVCAGENRVGATDFWLVIRGKQARVKTQGPRHQMLLNKSSSNGYRTVNLN